MNPTFGKKGQMWATRPNIVPEIERVILLREGRIAGDGPKAEMLTEQRLSALFGCAVKISVQDGYWRVAQSWLLSNSGAQ